MSARGRRARPQRPYQRLLYGTDEDPIGAVANLFDVAMVFAVALILALFTALSVPELLTSSDAEKDVAESYQYHANSYLVKPVGFEAFTEMMERLGFYWLAWNRYPWPSPVPE